MRQRAQVDSNQAEIVHALKQVGATVLHTHQLGHGAPDIAVGYRGINYWFEIKDGSKPPSHRKLTADEQCWYSEWRGDVQIVTCVDEALRVIGAIDEALGPKADNE